METDEDAFDRVKTVGGGRKSLFTIFLGLAP